MVYICKHCGEIVADSKWNYDSHFEDWEEDLWGHIQMEHEDVFEEVQDWETPNMLDECYEKESDMKIGDVVTITIDSPYGVDEYCDVKNETGVIVDSEESTGQWCVETGKPETSGWWFTEDELRPATAKEIEARLRYILMERKVI